MANRHLELGVFAPTIGCMPPAASQSFCLISSAEQRTDITFAYNRRVAEILEQAGLEIFFRFRHVREELEEFVEKVVPPL